MGLYDTVTVPCPECGEPYDAQSKSGECTLETYTLESAPDAVMANVNRHAPFTCDCGVRFMVVSRKACIADDSPPMPKGARLICANVYEFPGTVPEYVESKLTGVIQHNPLVFEAKMGNIFAMWDYFKTCQPEHSAQWHALDDKMQQSYGYPLSSWDCPDSPWGVCVYNHERDRVHDFCLVCGKPEERK